MTDSVALTVSLHTAGGKIREYTGVQDSRWIECQKVLNKAAFSIGITTSINNLEFQIIREFLASEFKDFSFQEISEAFSKYAAMKLSFKDKPYNNMNNLFIANVLNSYRDYRNEIVAKNRIELPKEEEKKLNDEDHFNSVRNYVEKNACFPDWGANIFLPAYRWLEKIESISNEEKKEFADKVRINMESDVDNLRKSGYNLATRAAANELTKKINDRAYFANHCRVEYLKNYFVKKYDLK